MSFDLILSSNCLHFYGFYLWHCSFESFNSYYIIIMQNRIIHSLAFCLDDRSRFPFLYVKKLGASFESFSLRIGALLRALERLSDTISLNPLEAVVGGKFWLVLSKDSIFCGSDWWLKRFFNLPILFFMHVSSSVSLSKATNKFSLSSQKFIFSLLLMSLLANYMYSDSSRMFSSMDALRDFRGIVGNLVPMRFSSLF